MKTKIDNVTVENKYKRKFPALAGAIETLETVYVDWRIEKKGHGHIYLQLWCSGAKDISVPCHLGPEIVPPRNKR